MVLMASLMMNMKPIDEVHVMRKTVIDGSNTTGFQRTCIIALDGYINVNGQPSPCKPPASKNTRPQNRNRSRRQKHRNRIDRTASPH
jgi:glutamyl-tRNA(Gln) amidotransferase subunit E